MQELLPLLEADEAVFKYSWYETRSNKINQVIENRDGSVSISASSFVLLGSVKTDGVALSQVDWVSPYSIRKLMIVLSICILWFLCATLKKGNPFGRSWKTWANSDKIDFLFTRFFCHIKISKCIYVSSLQIGLVLKFIAFFEYVTEKS